SMGGSSIVALVLCILPIPKTFKIVLAIVGTALSGLALASYFLLGRKHTTPEINMSDTIVSSRFENTETRITEALSEINTPTNNANSSMMQPLNLGTVIANLKL